MRLVLICVLGLLPRVAAADDLAVEAARAHYQAGKAYYAAGDFHRALSEFKAARGDSDRPELDYNIGLTYESLGDAARALAAYERYLSRQTANGDEVAILRARMPALQRHVGQLVIVSRVDGAIVKLDDEVLGATALRSPLTVSAGVHGLSATKDGMYLQSETVQVLAGQTLRVAIDPGRVPHKRLAGWAIGLITVGSLLVAGAVVGGVIAGTRHSVEAGYSGDALPGIVHIP